MLIRCTLIADGPGPSEAVVGVSTVEGFPEEVVISKRLMQHGGIEVGAPLHARDQSYLIELPRESETGRWRIWVPASEVLSAPELHMA